MDLYSFVSFMFDMKYGKKYNDIEYYFKLKLNITTDWIFFGVRIQIVHGQSPEHCKAEQEGPDSTCSRS